jgi:hypothetical protein
MRKKKVLAILFLPLLLASFLQSQSLAELAKKEKERRAALKGKATTTITTADIAKVKKRPAVETAEQEPTAEEQAAQTGEAEVKAQPEGAPPTAGQPAAEAAAGAAGEPAKAAAEPEKPAGEPPGEKPALSAQDIQKRQLELADIFQQKTELVDLLTLKLNALYQEFQSLDNLKSRETIQLQISDTYDKLLKAETESAKAKKDLEDFMAQVKKDQTPAIWIR